MKKIFLKYAVTMFIIVPYLAVLFSYLFGNFTTIWVVVLVLSLAPASPGMLKNVTRHGGNVNISTTWMIMTMFLSVIFLPANLLFFENILKLNVDLGIDEVAVKLMILFIIPMGAGFLIIKYLSGYAAIIKKILSPLSVIAMIALIICLLIVSVPVIIGKGILPVIYLLLFIITALIIALLMSSPEKEAGPILPYSVVLRLPAPAIVLTQINHTMERHMSVIITYTILAALIMFIYGKIFLREKKSV